MRGGGEREEREVCWRRDLSHAGEAGAGRGESAGGETCPCGGGRALREESLLAMRPVHAGEGEREESPLRGCYTRESAGGKFLAYEFDSDVYLGHQPAHGVICVRANPESLTRKSPNTTIRDDRPRG